MDEIDKLLSDIENDGFETEANEPKGKREAIEQSIKDVGTGFTSSFKMDPMDNAAKFLENAVPRGIREEYNVVKEAGEELKQLYDNNISDLRSGAKKTVDLIKMKTPENSIYRNILSKISSALGSNDPDKEGSYTREPTEDELVASAIERVFDKNRKKDNIEQVMQEVKEGNKFATTVSILTDVLGNLRYSNNFQDEITEKYYRKSLELQFKSLYVHKQQLEVTKTGFDLFKTQLEAIVKNSALPDLVKLRNSEQFKESIQHRFRENVTDAFYSKANPLTAMKNNIVGNIGKFMSGAKMGMETGNMFLEQANEMAAMGMGPSKSEMLGGELASYLRNYLGDEAGRAAEKNSFLRDKMYKAKISLADPRETLYELANQQFDKGTRMGRVSSKLLKMVGGITEADRQDFTRFGEYEPDEATVFDYRTKNSIVKVIPNLLSKIYQEVKGMRTGEVSEGVYFDYNTGKLQEDSNVKEQLLKDTAVTFQGAAGANLDRFTSLLERGGDKEFTDEEKNHIKGVIVGHLVKNGSISPEAMLKDKFLEQFDPKFRDVIKESISGTMDKAKDDLLMLDEFKSSLEGTRNNIPLMDKQIEQYFKNGQIENLEKMGLVDYDPLRKKYRLNREKYIDILKGSITYDQDKAMEDSVEKPITKAVKQEQKISPILKQSEEVISKSKPIDLVKQYPKTEVKPTLKETSDEVVKKVVEVDQQEVSKKINNLGMVKPITGVTETEDDIVKPIVEDTIKQYEKSKAKSIKNIVIEETKKLRPIIDNTIEETTNKLNDLNERIEKPSITDIISKDEVDPDTMYRKYQDSGASYTGLSFLSWANTLGYTFLGKKFTKLKNKDSKNEKMKESIFSKVNSNLEEMMEIDKETGQRKFTVRSILKKTREWDRKMFMSIPSVMKKLTVGAFKLPFTLFNSVKKTKNTVFGDKDGDGDRDMGWKDRLSNAAKGVKDKLTNKPKSKETTKKDGILGSIWNMLKGALPFLGTIAGLGGKLLKGVMGIIPAISSLGGIFTSAVGMLSKGVGMAASGALAAGKFIKDKITGKPKVDVKTPKKKIPPNKIMATLKSFKTKILKKLGKKAGAKALAVLAAKIAARAVPIAGLALLAYDGAMIAKYMISDGLSFGSAVSKQILGFDVFDDEAPAVDEEGNPIKPDENLKIKDPDEARTSGMESEIEEENVPKDKGFFGNVYAKIKNFATDRTNPVGKMVDKTSNFFKTGSFKATPSRQEIMGIIDKAAERTGVDPNTLKTFAAIESGFDPNAKAGTSSASGLFQFIKSTWRNMLKKYGPKYELDPMVSPFDPMANALMGAEYIKENTKALQGVRDEVGMTDLYMAHFLGPGGAKKLFGARPDEFAAAILPAAARANKSIFFNKDGSPRTNSEVYNLMQKRLVKKASAFGFSNDPSTDDQRKTNVESAKSKITQAATMASVKDMQPANNVTKPVTLSTKEYSIADGKGGQVKVNEDQFKQLDSYDNKLSKVEMGSEEWDKLLKEKEAVRKNILTETQKQDVLKPSAVHEVAYEGSKIRISEEQKQQLEKLRKEGKGQEILKIMDTLKNEQKASTIKSSIDGSSTNYMTAANNTSDPMLEKTKNTVKSMETAKAKSVAVAQTTTQKQDVLKPDQLDYTPNLTNIENVLLNSYKVQVGIKESIDTLVEYTVSGKEKKVVDTPNISKSSLEIPKPTVNLSKNRYVG